MASVMFRDNETAARILQDLRPLRNIVRAEIWIDDLEKSFASYSSLAGAPAHIPSFTADQLHTLNKDQHVAPCGDKSILVQSLLLEDQLIGKIVFLLDVDHKLLVERS